jgi:hypothetical protein
MTHKKIFVVGELLAMPSMQAVITFAPKHRPYLIQSWAAALFLSKQTIPVKIPFVTTINAPQLKGTEHEYYLNLLVVPRRKWLPIKHETNARLNTDKQAEHYFASVCRH